MEEMGITDRQAGRMVILESFAAGALFMPVVAARVSHGAVPAMVMGVIVAFVFGAFFIWASGRQGYFTGVQAIDGRFLHLLYALRFFLRSVIYLVVFVQMVKQFLLPEGSRLFIAVPVVVVTCYACLRTVVGRARLIELLFWWVLVPVILIWILSLPGWKWELLSSQSFSAIGVAPGNTVYRVYEMLLCYLPFESILYFMPMVMGQNSGKRTPEADSRSQEQLGQKADSRSQEQLGQKADSRSQEQLGQKAEGHSPGRPGKAVFRGLLIGLLLNLAIFCMAFFTIGEHGLRADYFSVCSMLKTVEAPGNVIARLDIAAMPFLMIGLFILYSGSIFYGCKAWEKVWVPQCIARHSWILPVAVSIIVFIVSLFLNNFHFVTEWYAQYALWVDLPLAVALPLICVIGSVNQGDAKKRKQVQNMFFFVIIMVCALWLTGCSGLDIEDQDYVLMLGVDGESKDIAATKTDYTYAAAMADMQGYKAEVGESVKMKTTVEKRDSLMAFRDSYSRNHATEMDFGHVKLLLFQEKLLEQPRRLTELLDTWEREELLSPTVMVAATREDAEKYIKLDEDSDMVLSVAIVNMLEKDGNVAVTLQDLYLTRGEGDSLVVPVLGIEDEEEFPQIVSYLTVEE